MKHFQKGGAVRCSLFSLLLIVSALSLLRWPLAGQENSQPDEPAGSLEELIQQLEQEFEDEIGRGLLREEGELRLSVQQALEQAWAFNLKLRAQQRSTKQAEAARKAFYLQFVPSLNLGAALKAETGITPYTREGDQVTESGTWNTVLPYFVNLGASVTLFDMKLLTSLSELSAAYQAAKISEETLRKSVAIKVIQQVYKVLRARKALESSERSRDLKSKYYGYARRDYEQGRISRLELLRARHEAESSGTELLDKQFAQRQAERTLNLLLGYVPQQQLEVEARLPQDVGTLLDQALPSFDPQMPELRQKELELQNAERGLRKAHLALLPQFAVKGTLSLSPIRSELYRSNGPIVTTAGATSLSGSIELNWDLSQFLPFSGSRRAIQMSRDQLTQAREVYQEEARQKRLEYLDGLQRLLQNKRLLEAQQSSLAVARERLREAELSYGRGIVSYDELLKAQQSLENFQNAADELVFTIMETLLQLGGRLNLQYF